MNIRMVRFLSLFLISLVLTACGGRAYTTRIINTPETRGLKAYEKPYEVNGERYEPLHSHAGFSEDGLASWYGAGFQGKRTSDGEIYNMHAMTAAHKILPLGVFVRVVNKTNGRTAIVRINDRGPFVRGRIIDLSYAAAKKLGIVGPGTAPVHIEALGYQSAAAAGHTTYHQPTSYDTGNFTIQVGAFAVQANAERLAGRLRARYGDSRVQQERVNGRLFYQVRVGKYRKLESAEAERANLETSGYAESFVVAVE